MKLELKDIIGYLPYGLKFRYKGSILNIAWMSTKHIALIDTNCFGGEIWKCSWDKLPEGCKPILKTELSEEEIKACNGIESVIDGEISLAYTELEEAWKVWEYLHSIHYDIHNLVEKGLAVKKEDL